MAYSLAWDSDHAQQHAGAGAAGLVWAPPGGPADLEALPGFRAGLYRRLRVRADELVELRDAVLCADAAVRTLAGLTLVPEHRTGHGALV